MKKILAIGISSGIIAVLWTIGSFTIGLSTVAGFLAWSSFFASGVHGIKGVKKALIANISGICWGFSGLQLSNLFAPSLGTVQAIAVGNGIGSLGICLQSRVPLVSFIPASFIGWSAFIASGMNFKITIFSMIIGSFLGYVSEMLTDVFMKVLRVNIDVDPENEALNCNEAA
jgi:hypothetical protein